MDISVVGCRLFVVCSDINVLKLKLVSYSVVCGCCVCI